MQNINRASTYDTRRANKVTKRMKKCFYGNSGQEEQKMKKKKENQAYFFLGVSGEVRQTYAVLD